MGKGLDGQAGGPNSGLSAKEEGKQVSQAKSKAGELKPGDVYFVLAAEWFRRWQSYTSESEAEKPGPIDNRVILLKAPEGSKDEGDKETEEYEPQLKPGLIDPDDYVQVSEAEWKLLFGWYVHRNSIHWLCGHLLRSHWSGQDRNGCRKARNFIGPALGPLSKNPLFWLHLRTQPL
jgi:hypothetical protein